MLARLPINKITSTHHNKPICKTPINQFLLPLLHTQSMNSFGTNSVFLSICIIFYFSKIEKNKDLGRG